MSASKSPIGFQRAAVLAAIIWFVAMFAILDSLSAHSPAAWAARMGSIAVIAGVVLNHRAFAAITGHASDQSLPPVTKILIALGITAILAGFVLGTIGY